MHIKTFAKEKKTQTTTTKENKKVLSSFEDISKTRKIEKRTLTQKMNLSEVIFTPLF